MLEAIVERLKLKSLLDSDYALLAAALVKGEVIASGSGAVAIAGNAPNATIVTINIAGGDQWRCLAELDKLGDAVGSGCLPSSITCLRLRRPLRAALRRKRRLFRLSRARVVLRRSRA